MDDRQRPTRSSAAAAAALALILAFAGRAGAEELSPGAAYVAGIEAHAQGRDAEAARLWRLAADACHAAAATALGNLYATGDGVAADPARSIVFYARAAALGDAQAQANLGDAYAQGFGVERDTVEALVWLGLAWKGGQDWAGGRFRAIEARAPADALAKAEARMAAFRPGDRSACPAE